MCLCYSFSHSPLHIPLRKVWVELSLVNQITVKGLEKSFSHITQPITPFSLFLPILLMEWGRDWLTIFPMPRTPPTSPTCIHTHMCTYMYSSKHTQIHTGSHSHNAHAYMYIHAYTCIQTFTAMPFRLPSSCSFLRESSCILSLPQPQLPPPLPIHIFWTPSGIHTLTHSQNKSLEQD